MRFRTTAATLALIAIPFTSAMAKHDHHDDDGDLLRGLLSTGATSASTYLTSGGDHKLVGPVSDDASTFIASDGAIRGPYLEAELQRIRSENPGLSESSDLELAGAILSAQAK
ncbi:DUF2388 domain-containing protein [Metapseudomonas resinovorans]|uniref:DUF2388 domain-containing protein n=1 Tax=Metapseudomonas resinovorans NBRC 106553 TaxID=1245471 RepID=S6ADG7_METRE|nr:DUF2388 domain-containing protein [Pseudomonas resinovorans]BAN47262.1 hypothetical protein PCA10_15300 [Pseudomonas resinovorans NBRC 106553]